MWTGFAGDPVTGDLFGLATKVTSSSCDSAAAIYQIDVQNVTASELALFEGVCFSNLAINNSGEIYSLDLYASNSLIKINRETWDYTNIGSDDWENRGSIGIAFDENGRLYSLVSHHLGSGFFSAAIVEIDINTGQRMDDTWEEIPRGSIPGKSGLAIRRE